MLSLATSAAQPLTAPGCQTDERRLLVETGGRKVGSPIEAWGFCFKVGALPHVIAFLYVAAFAAAGVALGDFGFERHNAGRLCLRLFYSPKLPLSKRTLAGPDFHLQTFTAELIL